MTITVLPMDATAGAPSYTAKNARQAQAALYGNTIGHVFGSRSGWRVGTLASIVSVTSTTWTLNPCAAMLEPGASLYQGMYGWASDAVTTGAVTAADATNPRIDILYIQVNDSSAGDGSGLLSAPVSYLAGVPAPAGTQVAPTLPARSFLVATIAVPKVGGGSPTITLNQTYFVAAGGVLPVISAADLATLTPYPGMAISRIDLTGSPIQTWDGTKWNGPYAVTIGTPTPNALYANRSLGLVAAGVYKLNGRTYLQGTYKNVGSITAGPGTAYPLCTLPAGYAPSLAARYPVIWDYGNGGSGGPWISAIIQVNTDGTVTYNLLGSTGSIAAGNAVMGLDGISWLDA